MAPNNVPPGSGSGVNGTPGQQQNIHRQLTNPQQIRRLLDENTNLIQLITEYQQKGRLDMCFNHQQRLHQNLVFLINQAESNPNIASYLPPS